MQNYIINIIRKKQFIWICLTIFILSKLFFALEYYFYSIIFKQMPTIFHWDCRWYFIIMNYGYIRDGTGIPSWAFFPLFPFLTRWIANVFSASFESTAVVLNQCMLFLSMCTLYKYIKKFW